jgi:hypothetical protein
MYAEISGISGGGTLTRSSYLVALLFATGPMRQEQLHGVALEGV